MKTLRLFFFLVLFVAGTKFNAQVLSVVQEIQQQSQWCWAACSKCVLNYYGTNTVTQCGIADYTRNNATWHNYGSANCCTNPNVGCNYWNYMWGYSGSLENILLVHGNIVTNNLSTALTNAEVQAEVTANNPFVIRWQWNDGSGHFMIGHGLVNNSLHYMNPLPGYGYQIGTYNWVLDDQSTHVWTHSQTFCAPLSAPGVIKGPAEICPGSTNIYSVTAVPGANGYNWTFPQGWTGFSSTNTVSANANSNTGTVSVTAFNDCGSSPASTVVVTKLVLDTAVAVSNGMLVAHDNAVAYKWYNCSTGQVVQGQQGKVFFPSTTGSFALIMEKGACSDTSQCYMVDLTGIEKQAGRGMAVFPNPASGKINIHSAGWEGTTTVRAIDGLGRIILEKQVDLRSGSPVEIDVRALSSGVYSLQFEYGESQFSASLVIVN